MPISGLAAGQGQSAQFDATKVTVAFLMSMSFAATTRRGSNTVVIAPEGQVTHCSENFVLGGKQRRPVCSVPCMAERRVPCMRNREHCSKATFNQHHVFFWGVFHPGPKVCCFWMAAASPHQQRCAFCGPIVQQASLRSKSTPNWSSPECSSQNARALPLTVCAMFLSAVSRLREERGVGKFARPLPDPSVFYPSKDWDSPAEWREGLHYDGCQTGNRRSHQEGSCGHL